jgi:DNA-binding transcriptional LysR family regulator
MDRRQLECFLAIVDHHGFTNAAQALHIAQPSLSQTIKRLERELGVDLFARLSHGVRLTSAGDALVEPARRTVRDFARAQAAVANVSSLESGHLDIVTLPALATDPAADLICRFRRRHPGIDVRLVAPSARDNFRPLRLGDSELGLTVQPTNSKHLTEIKFEFERFSIGLPPGHQGAEKPVLKPSDLGALNLIVSITYRAQVDQILAEAKVDEGHISIETSHREAIVPLVLGGAGAAILTPGMLSDARRRGLEVRPVEPAIGRKIALLYDEENLTPAALAFLDLLGGPGPKTVSYRGPDEEIVVLGSGSEA